MKLINILFLVGLLFSLAGCIKNEEVVYERNPVVEFDAATWNAKASGQNYPILTRVPPVGRAANTNDPSLKRTSGTINIRVNLVGPQQSTDSEILFEVMSSKTTAIMGYHFAPITGKVIIPANSNFGEIPLTIYNTGNAADYPVDIALQLISTSKIYSSENYKIIVLRVAP